VKIIILPEGKDPDEILKSAEDFQKYIDQAQSPI
jgi:DNA primase